MLKIHAVGVASVALIAISGCAELDPWSERSHTPTSPSSAYRRPLPLEYEAPPAAQPPPEMPNESLTLARCIEIALERNPQTRSSWEESRSAAAEDIDPDLVRTTIDEATRAAASLSPEGVTG